MYLSCAPPSLYIAGFATIDDEFVSFVEMASAEDR